MMQCKNATENQKNLGARLITFSIISTFLQQKSHENYQQTAAQGLHKLRAYPVFVVEVSGYDLSSLLELFLCINFVLLCKIS